MLQDRQVCGLRDVYRLDLGSGEVRIVVDDTGRVWAAAGDGLHCFDPDGTLLGKLLLPEVVANFTFGGRKRNDLFICASSSLYTLRVNFESHPSTSATRSATPAGGTSISS